MKLSRRKILIISLIIFAAISVFEIITWTIFLKSRPLQLTYTTPEKETTAKGEQVFSLMAKISRINDMDNTLIVNPVKEKKEIKVILTANTKIIKLEFPFNLSNPPEKEFTLKETELKISQLKVGETVFIRSDTNIAGKDVIGNIAIIEVLPH